MAEIDLPGPLAGRYEPRSRIGAHTLRAWDPRRRCEVFIKEMFAAAGPEALARYASAIAVAKQAGLPALVLPLEVVRDGAGAPFAVFEALAGRNLEALRTGALMWARAAEVVCRCAEALASATRATGVAHRDLRPDNIWFGEDGALLLLGFGAAELGVRPVGARGDGLFVEYRAPEQIEGGAGDARSDVFALGVLLFELTTGVHPFAGPSAFKVTHNVLLRPPPTLASAVTGMPAAAVREADAVLAKALARRPEDRFADAGALLRALEAARRSIGAPAHKVVAPAPVLAPAKPAPVADSEDLTTMLSLRLGDLAKQVKAAEQAKAAVTGPTAPKSTTPVSTTPVTRPAVSTSVVKPTVTAPVATPLATRPVTTPAATAPVVTRPVMSSVARTPVPMRGRAASVEDELPEATEVDMPRLPARMREAALRLASPARTGAADGPTRTEVLPRQAGAAPETTLMLEQTAEVGVDTDELQTMARAVVLPVVLASDGPADDGTRALPRGDVVLPARPVAPARPPVGPEQTTGMWASQRIFAVINAVCILLIVVGIALIWAL